MPSARRSLRGRRRPIFASPFGRAYRKGHFTRENTPFLRRGKAAVSSGCKSTRRTLQTEATEAAMEVTKWLKPSDKRITNYGDSALAFYATVKIHRKSARPAGSSRLKVTPFSDPSRSSRNFHSRSKLPSSSTLSRSVTCRPEHRYHLLQNRTVSSDCDRDVADWPSKGDVSEPLSVESEAVLLLNLFPRVASNVFIATA